MANYELIIETHQPNCSGKPLLYDFSEIETDDPVTYVKAHTKNAVLDVDKGAGGSMTIVAEEGDNRTKFVFTKI